MALNFCRLKAMSISSTFYSCVFTDISAPKNFKPKTQPCNFWCQNIGKKSMSKMLMKLTPVPTKSGKLDPCNLLINFCSFRVIKTFLSEKGKLSLCINSTIINRYSSTSLFVADFFRMLHWRVMRQFHSLCFTKP